jgi:hypothetical protein
MQHQNWPRVGQTKSSSDQLYVNDDMLALVVAGRRNIDLRLQANRPGQIASIEGSIEQKAQVNRAARD